MKELSSLFGFSSRVISNGVETIEIPFESSRRDGLVGYIVDRIKNEHGICIAKPVVGSIGIRLACETFPSSRPDIWVRLVDSGGGFHVMRDGDLQRYGVLGDTYEYVWGDPTVRLASVVSNVWYSLGCVESPRKQALRETCCLVDNGSVHDDGGGDFKNATKNKNKNRLNVMFEKTCRTMVNTLSLNSRNSDQYSGLDDDDDVHVDDCMVRPESFSYAEVEAFVNSLSEEEMVRALSDVSSSEGTLRAKLMSMVESRLSPMLQQNVAMAEANVQMVEELNGLKTQIAILKSEYEVKIAEFREKNARQEKARELFAPEVLIAQLDSSAKDYEAKSLKIVEAWKRGDISNDVFVKEYVDTRAKAYACRKKHSWAVASIPIPRRISGSSSSSSSLWGKT